MIMTGVDLSSIEPLRMIYNTISAKMILLKNRQNKFSSFFSINHREESGSRIESETKWPFFTDND